MKLRSPWLIGLVGLLGAMLIRVWMSTVRLRIAYAGKDVVHPADARKVRYIYAFWHESILAPTVFRLKISVLISQHADGELIAQACRHLGFGVVRGSSTRGGVSALLGMLSVSKQRHLMVTPDGPKGPRRQLALGIIFLASATGLPIVPVGVGFSKAWRLGSWDRFAVPWPFSTTVCVAGPPIHIPAHLDRNGLQRYRRLVEEEFARATQAAEQWAQTGVRTKPEALWPEDCSMRVSA
jgi:lysophospholipid acyltransferase (LPLAT)-like uncharacterized protein